MDDADFPEISQKRKDAIKALSKEQLFHEIELGANSSYARTIPYLKVVYQKILDNEKQAQFGAQIKTQEDLVNEAKEANQISKRANRFSVLAIIISLIALAVSAGLFK